jgi:hypothetical protein
MYLIWLTGVVIACSTRKRNPTPSLFALLAIGAMFVLSLIGTYVGLMPLLWRERGYDLVRFSMISGVANILLSILNAGCFGLLLAAIFVDRKPSVPEDSESKFMKFS